MRGVAGAQVASCDEARYNAPEADAARLSIPLPVTMPGRADAPVPPLRLRPAALLAAAATILVLLIVGAAKLSVPLRWAFVLAVVTLAPLLGGRAATGRPLDALGSPGLFAGLTLLGYLASLPAFLEERDAASVFLAYAYRDRAGSLEAALALATLGSAAFWAGWWVGRPQARARPRRSVRWNGRRLQLMVTLYSVLGLAAFSLGVVLIGGPSNLLLAQADRLRVFSGLNFLLYGAQLLPIAWLAVLRRRLEADGDGLTPRFLLLGLLAVSPTLLLGTKVIVIFVIGTSVLLFHQVRRRLRSAVVAVAGAVGLLGALGYDLYFREYLVRKEITSFVLSQLTPAERVNLVLERSVGSQFMQLQNLTVIVDAHDRDLAAEGGRTFLPVFTQLVPRLLYPSKPTTPSGMFALKLRPDLVEAGTTFPPSYLGELYWNAGAPLVFLGMLLLGWGSRRVEWWRARGDPMASVIGAITVMMMPLLLRGDFSDTVTAWVTLAVPTWLVLATTTVTKRTSWVDSMGTTST